MPASDQLKFCLNKFVIVLLNSALNLENAINNVPTKSPTGSSLLSQWRKRTSSDQCLQTGNWRTQRWHVINGISQIQQNDNEFVQTELKAGRKLASTGAQ